MTEPSSPESSTAETPHSTTWDIPTVAQLLLRTIALVAVIIAISNIESIFAAAEYGKAAGPIVATLLMLIGAVALWWFAEPMVNHFLKLRTDAKADGQVAGGESILEAAKRTNLFDWHAMFLSLIGIYIVVENALEFLQMLFLGFDHVHGSRVFLTILVLVVGVLFAVIPKKILQWLPMYKEIRAAQAKPKTPSLDAGDGADDAPAAGGDDAGDDAEFSPVSKDDDKSEDKDDNDDDEKQA